MSSRQYAQGLFAALQGQKEAVVKDALRNFVRILDRDQALGRSSEIIDHFQEIWDGEQGLIAAEVTSARPLDKAARNLLVDYLKNKTEAQDIDLSEKIDASLLGGFLLRYGSQVLDGSLQNSLQSLKNKISN